jgi:hypothetical protein
MTLREGRANTLGRRIGTVLVVTLMLRAPAADAASTITKGPWVQHVTSNAAVVRLEVDPAASVTVDLEGGLSEGDGGHRVFESADARTLHAIPVMGLKPGTRYAYSVRTGVSSKRAAFVTAPRDDADASFRFLVYGDNRTDEAAHAAVVRAMVPVASDFLLHTGDFVGSGASLPQWQTFFEIEAPLLGARCLFSCVGNHELVDGAGIEYARFFGPTQLPQNPSRPTSLPVALQPEQLDGTFRWGNARFFLLNGVVGFKRSVDGAWLERALTAADTEPGLRWRILVVHHGLWSSGPHGNNTRLQEAGIPALLKAHKVDLVISGHDHIYERGWGDGLAYVVSGGGGAPLYQIKAQLPQAKKVESAHHFVEMGVSPTALQLVAIRTDGSTIERCSLTKNVVGWDCDAPLGAAAASGSSPTRPSGAPASAPSRCACDAVGKKAGDGARASMLTALGALGLAVSRRRRSARSG